MDDRDSTESNVILSKAGAKTTRFLDDEYPSLEYNGSSYRKRESQIQNNSHNISSSIRNDKRVKEKAMANKIKNNNAKDIDSASEWETDNEEQNSRSSSIDDKEVLNVNSRMQNLSFQDNSQYVFTCENCPQPKSILRRISKNDSHIKETGNI